MKKWKIIFLGIITVFLILLFEHRDLFMQQWHIAHQYYVCMLTTSQTEDDNFWKTVNDYNKEQTLEQEKHIITLFSYFNNQQIENEEFARKETVAVYAMSGYSTALFPDAYLLTPEDQEGCIIDDQTAWNLFGSTKVVGKYINYNQKQYCIRDVKVDAEPFFAYEVIRDNNLQEQDVDFSMAAVSLQAQQNISTMKTQLENKYQIQGKYYSSIFMRCIRKILSKTAV